jgi:hypothetical protein
VPPPVDIDLIKAEREALSKIVVKKFSASPTTVETFGTTTVTWSVTVPADAEFDIEIALDGEPVLAQGSQSFTLGSPRTFSLTATTEHTAGILGRISVAVDASDCRTRRLVSSDLIESRIKAALDERFSGNGDFRLTGDKSTVSVGDGTIAIGIPLEIEVPNWFNADMDIGVTLKVSAGTPVLVTASSISVDVSWSFFEHLASLFCTSAVQSGMQKLARSFITDIVESDLAPGISGPLSDQVHEFLEGLTAGDPQHRTYFARIVRLSSSGLTVTACPAPA